IPNLLTFPTMVLGVFYHTAGNGWEGMLFSFGGLALGIILFIIPYLMGGMGAGDAKLLGAIGAIVGPKGVLISSILIAIAGGVYALVVFLLNTHYLKSFLQRSVLTVKTFAFTRHLIPIPADESEKKPKLCYGVAIAIGTFCYILLNFYGVTFAV
ncbi:MAG: prepilin peptidase, partial [Desulfobacterales bacterium]